jgi:hypothetical protein
MTDNEWIELSHEMERQDGFKKREADAIKNNRGKNVQVRVMMQSPTVPRGNIGSTSFVISRVPIFPIRF